MCISTDFACKNAKSARAINKMPARYQLVCQIVQRGLCDKAKVFRDYILVSRYTDIYIYIGRVAYISAVCRSYRVWGTMLAN